MLTGLLLDDDTRIAGWTIVFGFLVRLLIADRHRGGHVRGMWNLSRFLFGRRDVFPNIALEWLRFFKPSFDPWDHDNRAHLARIEAVVAEIEAEGGRGDSRAAGARFGAQ